MTPFPAIIPISDLRQNAAAIVQSVKQTQEPVVITQRGRPAVVVIDFDSFEDLRRKVKMMDTLMKSEEDITAGRLIDYGHVQAEIGKILERP